MSDKSLRLTISAVLNSTEREILGSLFTGSIGGGTLANLSTAGIAPATTPATAMGDSISPGVVSSADSALSDETATADISVYMSILSQRSDYLGQVKGMLSMLQESHGSGELAEQLLQEHLERMFHTALKEKDDEKLRRAILLIAASFVHVQGGREYLLCYRFN